MTEHRLYRTGTWTMVVVYASAAAVQVNDPDRWAWLAVYLAAAIVSLAALQDFPITGPAMLVGGGALIWAGTLLPTMADSALPTLFESWKMMSPEVEAGRELGGLLLVTVGMGVIAYHRPTVTNRRR